MFMQLQNCLNLSEIKLWPVSDIKTLHAIIKLSGDISSALFYNKKFTVIVYNAKVVFVI